MFRTFPGRLAGLVALALAGSLAGTGRIAAASERPISAEQAIRRAHAVQNQARLAERLGSGRSVDLYYEAAAFAYAGLGIAANEAGEVADRNLELYNDCVAGCLRTAAGLGRLNPRSRLVIETPTGTIDVPVIHRGFVWSSDEFGKLMNACPAPWNASEHRPHRRCGLGAAEVVERANPGFTNSDRFLPRLSFFPATAVLRPDLAPWLGRPGTGDEAGAAPHGDVLELYDPIRTRCVDLAGRRFPLSANLDAPLAFAHEAEQSRKTIREGFRDPDKQLDRVGIELLEPHQPGKVLLVLVHGLRDDPFHFTDMIGALRLRPGFVDRYQIAAFHYPTGDTFLRSAAQLRQGLREVAAVFDPPGTDPGIRNMVVVGFSMGGLLAKLQIAEGGDALWAKASPRPLDAINTDESSRELLRAMFYFEPVPSIRRVIYIATPHDGASIPTQVLGRTYTRVLRQPSDTHAIAKQLVQDNPDAILPFLKDMPSSLDLMSHERPFLRVMRRIPVNPATLQHTIAGTGYLPASIARGDGVMSLASAHVDGAASEALVPAIHTNICTSLDVIAEIERILRVHLQELGTTERQP